MNAKQMTYECEKSVNLKVTEALTEKQKKLNLWNRLKQSFSKPDLDLEIWERLESKRSRSSSGYEQQWRNY